MRTVAICVLSLPLITGCNRSNVDLEDVAQAMDSLVDSHDGLLRRMDRLATKLDQLAKQVEQNSQATQELAESLKVALKERENVVEREASEERLDHELHLAHRLWEDGKLGQAAKLFLAIAKKRPGTGAAEEAEERLLHAGLHPGDLTEADPEAIAREADKLAAPIALMRRAHILEEAGKSGEAVQVLSKLTKEHPDSRQGREARERLSRLGVADGKLEGLSAEQLGKRLAAQRSVRRLLHSAYALREAGKPVDGLFQMLQAMKTAPDHPEVREVRHHFERLGIEPDACLNLTLEAFREKHGAAIVSSRKANEMFEDVERRLDSGPPEKAAAALRKLLTDEALEETAAAREARHLLREWGIEREALKEVDDEALGHKIRNAMQTGRLAEKAERLTHAGKFFEAARALRQLAEEQPDTRHAREALEQIEEWGIADQLDDEGNRDKVNESLRRRRELGRTFERAEHALHQGRTREGLEALQRVAKAGGHELAEEAEEILRHYRVPDGKISDETVKQVAEAMEAQRLHSRAERLLDAGSYAKAIEQLQALCKKHPDSRAAEEAQDLLMECGAWEVEITDANRKSIVKRLKRMHREDDEEEEDDDDD